MLSTANRAALLEEWSGYALLDYADVILAQDSGSKEHCIRELLKKCYRKNHILMVGDAPGDLEAAKQNGVCFYPMLCGYEEESWTELRDLGYNRFQSATYESYEASRIKAFFRNLNVQQA